MHVLFGSWYLLFNHCKYDVMYTHACREVLYCLMHTTTCVTCFSCVDSYATQKHPRVSTFFFCGKTKTSWKVLSIIEKYLLNKATRFHSSTCLYISKFPILPMWFGCFKQKIGPYLMMRKPGARSCLTMNIFINLVIVALGPIYYFGAFLWHWQVRSQNMANHGKKKTTSAYSIITYN